jgi:hypothetical protein
MGAHLEENDKAIDTKRASGGGEKATGVQLRNSTVVYLRWDSIYLEAWFYERLRL